MTEQSSGYEASAREYQRARSPSIGRSTVLDWSRRLKPGASILELGCGDGIPISKALLDAGFALHGVDASTTFVEEFKRRFPGVEVECNTVEDSAFFNREFDAVVAWGLLFLLPPQTQRMLIGKVARALRSGGQFLFTSPRQAASWPDAVTGQPSVSLGQAAYSRELAASGLKLRETAEDEGQNHYYFAAKP